MTYSNYPGSGYDGQPMPVFQNPSLAQIAAPSRTANISDAYTVVNMANNKVVTRFGCEGDGCHKSSTGFNMGFLDGHARFFVGKPESAVSTAANGG